MATKTRRKKFNLQPPDPEYAKKNRESLLRKHKLVVCLNDKELAAVEEYCKRFGVNSKSRLFREAAIKHILDELDNSHPTLF